MKPLDEWTEDYLASLPSGEDDRFDRKASQALLDAAAVGPERDKKRRDMSCDLSAYANSGGGYLIYGVNDKGDVDGGVPKTITVKKPSNTYEWLDSLLPGLVEPTLRGFRIKVIERESNSSRILPDHAIYVVEVPDSDDAPHQAGDRRYYIRINGHNQQAPHRVIEDIRNRRRTPKVAALLECRSISHSWRNAEGMVVLETSLYCVLTNSGPVTAKDVSLAIAVPKEIKLVPRTTNVTVGSPHDPVRVDLSKSLHPYETLPVLIGQAKMVLEYSTFVENNTKKPIETFSMPIEVFMENVSPVEIEGRFAEGALTDYINWLRDSLQ